MFRIAVKIALSIWIKLTYYEPTNTAAWRSVVWGERKTTQAVGAAGLSVGNRMWQVGT